MIPALRLITLIQDAAPILPDAADVPSRKEEIAMLRNLPVDELLNHLVTGIVTLAINIALAILVFYIGKFIITKLLNLVRNILVHRRIEASLSSFVQSFVRIVLYFILIVTVIGILGIETSSFLALFASAGVAIGMALSGTLQNFAGGVLILLLKPYRVGNFIDAQGYQGTVKEIQIFHTVIVTPDNKAIIIPNGGLSTGSINNWSREHFRRADWTVGIAYDSSIEEARALLLDIASRHPKVMHGGEEAMAEPELETDDASTGDAAADEPEKPARGIMRLFSRHRQRIQAKREEHARAMRDACKSPCAAPAVVLADLADSAVVLKLRAWVRTDEYWEVYNKIYEDIYTEITKSETLSFPFPQLDVHFDKPAEQKPA